MIPGNKAASSPSMVAIIMGVAGSGKTTVAHMLASQLQWEFSDADDYHSAANKAKMSQGGALSDEDRLPWLESMRADIRRWLASGHNHVLSCSALKRSYREFLAIDEDRVRVVYLQCDQATAEHRLKQRVGHFMNVNMLESQFQALEEPSPEEAVIIDATLPVEQIVSGIRARLGV